MSDSTSTIKESVEKKMENLLELTYSIPESWPKQEVSLNRITNDYIYDIEDWVKAEDFFDEDIEVRTDHSIYAVDTMIGAEDEKVTSKELKDWLRWYMLHRWYNNAYVHQYAVECFVKNSGTNYEISEHEDSKSHDGDIRVKCDLYDQEDKKGVPFDIKVTSLFRTMNGRFPEDAEKKELIQTYYLKSAKNERNRKQNRLYIVVKDWASKADLKAIGDAIDSYCNRWESFPTSKTGIKVDGKTQNLYCDVIFVENESEEFCELRQSGTSCDIEKGQNRTEQKIRESIFYPIQEKGSSDSLKFSRLWVKYDEQEQKKIIYFLPREVCEIIKNKGKIEILKNGKKEGVLRLVSEYGSYLLRYESIKKHKYNPKTDDPRKKAINNIEKNYMVEAGAGSGKTTVLVGRMVSMIEKGVPSEEICSLTFTNDAARELETRFVQLLEIRAKETKALTEDDKKFIAIYDKYLGKSTPTKRKNCRRQLCQKRWYIGTLDRFILRLANRYIDRIDFRDLGREEKPKYISALTDEGYAIRDSINSFYEGQKNAFYGAMNSLNWPQNSIIYRSFRLFLAFNGKRYTSFEKYESKENYDKYREKMSPILPVPSNDFFLIVDFDQIVFREILEYMLDHPDAYFGYGETYSREILTNKIEEICNEIREKEMLSHIYKGSGKAFFDSLEKYICEEKSNKNSLRKGNYKNCPNNKYANTYVLNNTLWTTRSINVSDFNEYKNDGESILRCIDDMTIDKIAMIHGLLRFYLLDPRTKQDDVDRCESVYEKFENIRYSYTLQYIESQKKEYLKYRFDDKSKRLQLTFPEIHYYAKSLLEKKPDILEEMGYRYFCIDEFQDTSSLQMSVISLLAGQGEKDSDNATKKTSSPGSVFVVGDPKQSIYHFRGGDIKCYLTERDRFEEKFRLGMNYEILGLPENYRSNHRLIGYYNAVFKKQFERKDSNVQCDYEDMICGNSEASAGQSQEATEEGVFIYNISNLVSIFTKNDFSQLDKEGLTAILKGILEKHGADHVMVLASENYDRNPVVDGFYTYLNQLNADVSDSFKTIHKAKGLEADVVILFDPDQLFYRTEHSYVRYAVDGEKDQKRGYVFDVTIKEEEDGKTNYFHDFNNYGLDENVYRSKNRSANYVMYKDMYDTEKKALDAENIRKLYVAATRARKKLIIISRDPQNDTYACEETRFLHNDEHSTLLNT